METLTLPEPARQLWAAKREIVHDLPPELFQAAIRPQLGGGTILAARWQHRVSTDIDIVIPGRNTLVELIQDNDDNIVKRLGGTPESMAPARVKIAFAHGKLDLSILKPDPPFAQAEALVDGVTQQHAKTVFDSGNPASVRDILHQDTIRQAAELR